MAEGICELDDAGSFYKIYARLRIEKKPVGESERFLVRHLALCQVRLQRAIMFEAEYLKAILNPRIDRDQIERLALDALLAKQSLKGESLTGEEITAEISAVLADLKPVVDPGALIPRVTSNAVAELCLYQRYESAAEDRFYRTQKELNLLQRERRRREGKKN